MRTVDGDERDVVDEDDKADGQGDERGHVGVLHGAGRVRAEEHREDEEQCADDLPEEGLCWVVGWFVWCHASHSCVLVGARTPPTRRNDETRDGQSHIFHIITYGPPRS